MENYATWHSLRFSEVQHSVKYLGQTPGLNLKLRLLKRAATSGLDGIGKGEAFFTAAMAVVLRYFPTGEIGQAPDGIRRLKNRNCLAADRPRPSTVIICPFLIMCMSSMPNRVTRAERKEWNPNIGRTIRLTAR